MTRWKIRKMETRKEENGATTHGWPPCVIGLWTRKPIASSAFGNKAKYRREILKEIEAETTREREAGLRTEAETWPHGVIEAPI